MLLKVFMRHWYHSGGGSIIIEVGGVYDTPKDREELQLLHEKLDLIDKLTSHLQNRYENALIDIIPHKIFRNIFTNFRHSVNKIYLLYRRDKEIKREENFLNSK